MTEKLRILMQSEKLTASKLAEILEVKPAAISHILSGRNKPSFEMLCKIVNRFPQINPYWLLGEATEMRNANATNSTPGAATSSASTLTVVFLYRGFHSSIHYCRSTAAGGSILCGSADWSNHYSGGHLHRQQLSQRRKIRK